jgi:hypothetical protein
MGLIILNEQEKKDLLVLLKSSDNECYDNIIKKLRKKPIWKRILYVLDGRFGNKVLKEQYRGWWRLFTYGTLVILFIRFVMFPFFQWWDGVVSFLNYVIWG